MAIEFNTEFYLQSKFNQLEEAGLLEEFGLTDVASLEQFFEDNGVDAREHYLSSGMAEGINPSAEFDTSAYLEAKLAELQNADKYGDTYADFTVEDVIEAFQGAGLTALEHFNDFGEAEGLEAVPAEGETSGLTEALEVYETAVEEQTKAEAAYSEAVVEAGLIENTGNFDATEDYVGQAEAVVQTAIAKLASARADASDAAVNTAATQAQAAVNGYAVRFNEDGTAAADSTTYSLAQLQARAINAESALASEVAANGKSVDLATDLKDGIALYLAQNADVGTTLADLSTNIDAFLDGADTEAVFLDNVQTAFDDLAVDAEGNSDLADGARAETVESLLVTLQARNELSEGAVDTETAFVTAEDAAALDGAFGDVDFVSGADDLTTALAVQDAREGLIDALETAQANQEAVTTAATGYADAEQAVVDAGEELGYDIQGVDSSSLLATEESDLFIFDAEAADDAGLIVVAINGLESDDLLFLGSDYALGAEGSADNNALEVFVTEANGNAVLQIENSAFGSVSDDFTEITLTGIAQSDVNIESGVVSIVEAA